MNKYQEALDLVKPNSQLDYDYLDECPDKEQILKAYETLQELIDKATPKKPYGNNYQNKRCPYCKARVKAGCGSSSRVRYDYCCKCGQALDWREENGK